MPCDTWVQPQQTPPQRKAQIDEALERLEAALTDKSITINIDRASGALAFAGWKGKDRFGVTDACAYRKLASKGSFAFRQALATAEATAGRNVNEQTIAAGVHSHDGGKTWGRD